MNPLSPRHIAAHTAIAALMAIAAVLGSASGGTFAPNEDRQASPLYMAPIGASALTGETDTSPWPQTDDTNSSDDADLRAGFALLANSLVRAIDWRDASERTHRVRPVLSFAPKTSPPVARS